MNTIESIYIHKTVVDNNNILWSMSLDKQDNTVTITSDYATLGTSAVLSQYSMDNDTGHDIPDTIVDSATALLEQDEDRVPKVFAVDVDAIIDEFANPKQARA